jgi:post-segregation antitoxin (ccd killing protein)
MSRRKAKQSRTKSNVDRSKGSKTPKETPILVSRIINRIRKRHLPVSQITKQIIIAETSREYPDLYQKKANRKARAALKHLLK